MKLTKWPVWVGLTAAAVLTVVLYNADRPQLQGVESVGIDAPSYTAVIDSTKKRSCAFWSKCDFANAATNAAPAIASASAPEIAGRRSRAVMAGQEVAEKVEFQVDAKGRIIMDERARLNIEKLYALNEPGERAKKQRELAESLPPAANRELTALMARYETYQEEQLQRFPPGQDLDSAAEGIAHLDALHELRIQRFGPEAAFGLFGAEEKMQRELLIQMSLDKDKTLTLEQKAEKAQALH